MQVNFTENQLRYLDKQFPEVIGSASTTNDELRWRAAQRSVLQFIRVRVQKQGGIEHVVVE